MLIARVGLSHFVSRLDDLILDPSLVAASSASVLPRQVTRTYAAAVTASGAPGLGEATGTSTQACFVWLVACSWL